MFVTLCGCAVFRASPAPDSGFLPHGDELKPLSERSPFHGVWYSDKIRLDEMKKVYGKVHIAAVDTSFLEAKIKSEKRSEDWKVERIEDLHEIARYMHERLKNSITEYPNHPMKVVDDIDQKTFVLEMTIVELDPTNTAITTLSAAAGFFVPGTGILARAGSGSIAMEGISRDGGTGDSLVEIKDRATDKTAPVSIKDYQMYAHSRSTIDDWSEIFAELTATPHTHRVKGRSPVTLSPF